MCDGSVENDDVARLLDRFLAEIRDVVPLTALWAHGSLALGDFQIGRSDFDLIALVDTEIDDEQRQRLKGLHEKLMADVPLATKLHCSYVVRWADAGQRHLTWAQEHMFDRPVTPVTRRELAQGGLVLFGPPPAELLPAVTDEQLFEFIRRDLRTFWLPATAKRVPWLRDIWVDLGSLILARATVTLREGRLITKGEALDVLLELGAPVTVVNDIREGRYGHRRRASLWWRVRRGHLARTFVRAGIAQVLGD
jgi:hypothetical protein